MIDADRNGKSYVELQVAPNGHDLRHLPAGVPQVRERPGSQAQAVRLEQQDQGGGQGRRHAQPAQGSGQGLGGGDRHPAADVGGLATPGVKAAAQAGRHLAGEPLPPGRARGQGPAGLGLVAAAWWVTSTRSTSSASWCSATRRATCPPCRRPGACRQGHGRTPTRPRAGGLGPEGRPWARPTPRKKRAAARRKKPAREGTSSRQARGGKPLAAAAPSDGAALQHAAGRRRSFAASSGRWWLLAVAGVACAGCAARRRPGRRRRARGRRRGAHAGAAPQAGHHLHPQAPGAAELPGARRWCPSGRRRGERRAREDAPGELDEFEPGAGGGGGRGLARSAGVPAARARRAPTTPWPRTSPAMSRRMRPPPSEAVRFLANHHGIVEPDPLIYTLRRSGATAERPRAVPAVAAPRVHPAAASAGTASAWARSSAAQELTMVVTAVGAVSGAGAGAARGCLRRAGVPLAVRLLAPVHQAAAGGHHARRLRAGAAHAACKDGDRFDAELRCSFGDGRYQVEMLAADATGPLVLANFPVFCGVRPARRRGRPRGGRPRRHRPRRGRAGAVCAHQQRPPGGRPAAAGLGQPPGGHRPRAQPRHGRATASSPTSPPPPATP